MQGILDALVTVAKNHGAPGTDVIDVALVVFVVQVGALGVLEENGRTTDTAKRPDRRIHATGDVFLSLFEQGFGVRHGSGLLLFGN